MECPLCRTATPAGKLPATWIVTHLQTEHPREWRQHTSVERHGDAWVRSLEKQMAAAA